MLADAAAIEHFVTRLVEEGVPASVVARAFDLDVDLVKEVRATVRVRLYTTADMDEYLESLRWAVMSDAFSILRHGSTMDRTRLTAAVLGRQITASARKPSEGEKEQKQLIAILEKILSLT